MYIYIYIYIYIRPFLPHIRAQTHIQIFSQGTLIKPKHCKKSRRLLESAIISKTNYIKQRPGFYQISPFLANIILNKIKIENDREKNVTLCHHTFENPFLLLFLNILPLCSSSAQLQPRHHNIDNFRRHHIIAKIFPWNKICQNPFHTNPSLISP